MIIIGHPMSFAVRLLDNYHVQKCSISTIPMTVVVKRGSVLMFLSRAYEQRNGRCGLTTWMESLMLLSANYNNDG
jgi:hypothetical protein